MSDIVSKWVVNYKNWNLGITSDNRVFCLNYKTELVEYWNNGSISYRIPKTSRRIGIKTMRENCKMDRVPIILDCPF